MNYIYQTYINKRMMILLALGFTSGFPFLLVFGTLSFWLKDLDISYSLIGAFSLVKIPYSLKWTWSPLIDNIKIPYLYKMGRRRSWAVLIQTLLFLSLTAMAFTHPEKHTLHMAMYAFIASFLSASQDIILDAYRVESFENEPEKQASGVAIYVLGYRLGLIFSGAGAIYLASVISWNEVYLVMACGLLVGFIAVLLASEPQKYSYKKSGRKFPSVHLFLNIIKKLTVLVLFLIFFIFCYLTAFLDFSTITAAEAIIIITAIIIT